MQKHTLQDIIKYTGLKPDFLRKVIKELEQIFTPYISRGDKNAMLFDSNSLFIFDRIKQLKEKDCNIQMMKEKLLSELKINTETDTKTERNINQNTLDNYLYKELKEMSNRLLVSKEETIQTQKEQIKTLESKILLITDGRSPEEVKKEFIDKEVELKLLQNKSIELEEKLKLEKALADENKIAVALKEKELAEQKSKSNTLEIEVKNSKEITIKQDLILSDKENKLVSIENQKKLLELELEEQKKKTTENESKKIELLNQLEGLEGKWFVGTKRKQLLKQLKELS